jgi:hypothetical protein
MLIKELYEKEHETFIFINVGIGDFLHFDSLLSDKIRENIKNIVIWNAHDPSNSKGNTIVDMIRSNNYYDKKIKIIDIKHRIARSMSAHKQLQLMESILSSSTDFDFSKSFNQHFLMQDSSVRNNSDIVRKLAFENEASSSYFKQELTDIKKFKLPKEYCIIANHTSSVRYLDKKDMENTFKILDFVFGMSGVLIGNNRFDTKKNNIINLIGLTSVEESIELIKNASAYIGIDSYISILASQLLPEKKLIIKANAPRGMLNFFFYRKENLDKFVYNKIDWFEYCSKNKFIKLFI